MAMMTVEVVPVLVVHTTQKFTWHVLDVDGEIIAEAPARKAYDSREAALAGLFNIFFGIYDQNSYMSLYAEWQKNELARTGSLPDTEN